MNTILISFSRHQFKKITTDRKRLVLTDLGKRWVRVMSLVQVNRAIFFSFVNALKSQRGKFLADPTPG